MTMSISAPVNPVPRGMLQLLGAQMTTVRQNAVGFVHRVAPEPAPVSGPPAGAPPPVGTPARGSSLDIIV
ncbi:MAG TPA: hypothetical protein VEB64_09625 [Azospirillaceae bacterium]|nr:hypothetical protein [Azospirillaceae bacterium]